MMNGSKQPIDTKPSFFRGATRLRLLQENWGDRRGFQTAHGLTMSREDREKGTAILEIYLEQARAHYNAAKHKVEQDLLLEHQRQMELRESSRNRREMLQMKMQSEARNNMQPTVQDCDTTEEITAIKDEPEEVTVIEVKAEPVRKDLKKVKISPRAVRRRLQRMGLKRY
ncbi:hypothetical protein BJ508DRAFT_416446 [Ascobolus immersus RN42]|uniref:Uncharacterized protein n=1 Tax=Ascobolus immersus RN42 TaxID=1160509 RepID=A0A3N4HYG6_ASCIM|nr:hypothetical protein BJ508DRAFT_416446 [Ascobolus immersus RN42]